MIDLFIIYVKQQLVIYCFPGGAEGRDFSVLYCTIIVLNGRKMIILSALMRCFMAREQGDKAEVIRQVRLILLTKYYYIIVFNGF
ncbi:hypothetical protein [Kosakonia oryzae]|uniref:hypothetical protein n=1 Tax=Kosakonia oryzae TaxID=497725 RepID=UPI001D07BB7C|nr:hypothetical protein [Kosakonia oryzae]UDJ83149.1 hypothetical protein I5186_03350 [Kosakonia oryzae]